MRAVSREGAIEYRKVTALSVCLQLLADRLGAYHCLPRSLAERG
jgi:hypothetical protein